MFQEKRSIFPRLYFLSDDDLLELLGQARAGADGREVVMQTHLKKLFPGTTGVRLGPGEMSITAMCSNHGETFQLEHPVDIDCPVEVSLLCVHTSRYKMSILEGEGRNRTLTRLLGIISYQVPSVLLKFLKLKCALRYGIIDCIYRCGSKNLKQKCVHH